MLQPLPKVAFSNIFGNAVGTIVMVFIIISCLGTTNGITLGCMRGLYSISVRGMGPKADVIAEIDESTGMPLKSCLVGMMLCGFWYFQASTLFFNGPLVLGTTGNPTWFFAWEADEIVIITQYALYIPIFAYLIFKEKDFGVFQRFVLPVLGILACLFMCYCCYVGWGTQVFYYLIFFVIVMAVGLLLKGGKKKDA